MDSNYSKFNIDDYTKSLKSSSYSNPAFSSDNSNLKSSKNPYSQTSGFNQDYSTHPNYTHSQPSYIPSNHKLGHKTSNASSLTNPAGSHVSGVSAHHHHHASLGGHGGSAAQSRTVAGDGGSFNAHNSPSSSNNINSLNKKSSSSTAHTSHTFSSPSSSTFTSATLAAKATPGPSFAHPNSNLAYRAQATQGSQVATSAALSSIDVSHGGGVHALDIRSGSTSLSYSSSPRSSKVKDKREDRDDRDRDALLQKYDKSRDLKASNYFKSTGEAPYGRSNAIYGDTTKRPSLNVSENMRMAFLCSTWYILSAVGNVLNKYILTNYFMGYPTTISFSHILSICLLMPALFKLWRISPHQPISRRYSVRSIFPLAVGKFLSSVSSQFSISKVPVSYAHTIKASMPLFTVCLTTCLFKEKHSPQVWLSLMPIFIGVAIATLTELQFQWDGMISALLATACFSLQNIYSKIVLRETRMHHLRLLYLISTYTFALLLPTWLMYDFPGYFKDESLKEARDNPFTAFLLLLVSGLIMLSQNVVAFSVIHFLSPLSYSVANAGKRIVVILFSLMTLRNPVTLLNIFGMSISVGGVYIYNRAKLLQDGMSKKNIKYGLPTSSKDVREGLDLHKTHNYESGAVIKPTMNV